MRVSFYGQQHRERYPAKQPGAESATGSPVGWYH